MSVWEENDPIIWCPICKERHKFSKFQKEWWAFFKETKKS